MAATVLTAQTSARTGIALTFAAPDAVAGIEFNNASNKSILLVKNDSASPVVVTFDVTATVDGLAIPDRQVSVAAGALEAIGPFNDLHTQSDGFVRATVSAVTSVTVALIKPGSLAI